MVVIPTSQRVHETHSGMNFMPMLLLPCTCTLSTPLWALTQVTVLVLDFQCNEQLFTKVEVINSRS